MPTESSTLTLVSEIPSTLVNAEPLKGLAVESSASLVQAFSGHFSQFYALVEEANAIPEDAPKAAKVMRLKIVKIRTGADKTRAALKAEGIRIGKAVEGVNNLLLNDLAPLETRLQDIELKEERREAALITARAETRRLALLPFVPVEAVVFYDLGNMPAIQFDHLLLTSKLAKEAADAALAKADADRIEGLKKAEEARVLKEQADAAERTRLAAENAKLAQEAKKAREAQEAAMKKAAADAKVLADAQKAKDAQLSAERAKEQLARDLEIKRLADQQRAKDAEAEKVRLVVEAKAKVEKDRADGLEAKAKADAQAIKDAQIKVIADQEAAKNIAAKAPDKTKLATFAKMVRDLQVPRLSSGNGTVLNAKIASQVNKFALWIEAEAAKL